MSHPSSLYIHIPFCRRKCVYCNFYSNLNDSSLEESLISVLTAEIARLEGPFTTIYIGGGTPCSLDPGNLKRLISSLGRFSKSVKEFTFEANPDTLDPEKMRLLHGHGVNRLSIGVQSFRDEKLKRLGRLHNSRKSEASIAESLKSGFTNISIDMIFGLSDEKADTWREELRFACRLPVRHISCYELTYEDGTPLHDALKRGSVKRREDEALAGMYESAVELLGVGGFKRYEVSNFAKIGSESLHNMSYWQNNEYVGLGPSAVSYLSGVRSKRVSDIGQYIKRERSGLDKSESSERLSPLARAKETAAVKIRAREGIDFAWFKEKTGYGFMEVEKKAIEDLLEKDLIKFKREGAVNTGIALKHKGFLFCDTVSSALL